jgi:hypothetical protein
MLTRSGKEYFTPLINVESKPKSQLEVEVDIDFDEASREWQSNKKSIGNSSYKYVCQKVGNTGKMCRSKCLAGEHYCSKHI